MPLPAPETPDSGHKVHLNSTLDKLNNSSRSLGLEEKKDKLVVNSTQAVGSAGKDENISIINLHTQKSSTRSIIYLQSPGKKNITIGGIVQKAPGIPNEK